MTLIVVKNGDYLVANIKNWDILVVYGSMLGLGTASLKQGCIIIIIIWSNKSNWWEKFSIQKSHQCSSFNDETLSIYVVTDDKAAFTVASLGATIVLVVCLFVCYLPFICICLQCKSFTSVMPDDMTNLVLLNLVMKWNYIGGMSKPESGPGL